MPLRFNELTQEFEVIPVAEKRGPKRRGRPHEKALQSSVGLESTGSLLPDSTGDAFLDAIVGITRSLATPTLDVTHLDETVIRELEKLGYSLEDLKKNPFIHRNTLQQIRDMLEAKRTHHATQMGEFGGLVVGEQTLRLAAQGKRLRLGIIKSD